MKPSEIKAALELLAKADKLLWQADEAASGAFRKVNGYEAPGYVLTFDRLGSDFGKIRERITIVREKLEQVLEKAGQP
jgi:hypothetical protein